MQRDNNWKPLCTDNKLQLQMRGTDYQSVLIICHLKKLGIDITCAFAFCTEVELVIAAIRTCNCSRHNTEQPILLWYHSIVNWQCCSGQYIQCSQDQEMKTVEEIIISGWGQFCSFRWWMLFTGSQKWHVEEDNHETGHSESGCRQAVSDKSIQNQRL